jgi:hypothetical protein
LETHRPRDLARGLVRIGEEHEGALVASFVEQGRERRALPVAQAS